MKDHLSGAHLRYFRTFFRIRKFSAPLIRVILYFRNFGNFSKLWKNRWSFKIDTKKEKLFNFYRTDKTKKYARFLKISENLPRYLFLNKVVVVFVRENYRLLDEIGKKTQRKIKSKCFSRMIKKQPGDRFLLVPFFDFDPCPEIFSDM